MNFITYNKATSHVIHPLFTCAARVTSLAFIFVKENKEYVKVNKAGVIQLANTIHKCCDIFTLYCVQAACACCLLLFLMKKESWQQHGL